ncbi:MAG: hypothetical protein COB61_009670 [Thiotrichales bacterium]|nr:hypothetical protein [Thiotrichales bacterium]
MYGVSEELCGLIAAICESTDSCGNPRFSGQARKDFKQRVLFRNLNKPLWWLVNLVTVIELTQTKQRTGSAVLDFFWADEMNTAAKIRDKFSVPLEKNGVRVEYNENLKISYPDGEFFLFFSQLPLLVIIIEFLIYIDPDFYKRCRSLAENTSVVTVDQFSRRLQSQVGEYLGKHLQPQQQQKKCRELLEWLSDHPENFNRDTISDEVILDFWVGAADASDMDFKLYNNVAESFIDLFYVLGYNDQKFSVEQAFSIGSDIEYGEVDLERLSEVLDVYDVEHQVLSVLKEQPLSHIKFLTDKDFKLLSPLEYVGHFLNRLSLTLARMACFGKHQVSIGQYIRKDKSEYVHGLVNCIDVTTYKDYASNLLHVKHKLEKTQDCIAHILITHKHFEGAAMLVELMSEDAKKILRKKLNLENSELIADKLFEKMSQMAFQIPELNMLMRRFKGAFDSINREGFKEMPPKETIEHYVSGASVIHKAQNLIGSYVVLLKEIIEVSPSEGGIFSSDLDIYKVCFEKLYRDWL